MNESEFGMNGVQHLTVDRLTREDASWHMETLAEQIWKELDGVVLRCEIDRVLHEIAPAYADARVQTFVPIFLRREAIRRLRSEMAQRHVALFKRECENAG